MSCNVAAISVRSEHPRQTVGEPAPAGGDGTDGKTPDGVQELAQGGGLSALPRAEGQGAAAGEGSQERLLQEQPRPGSSLVASLDSKSTSVILADVTGELLAAAAGDGGGPRAQVLRHLRDRIRQRGGALRARGRAPGVRSRRLLIHGEPKG